LLKMIVMKLISKIQRLYFFHIACCFHLCWSTDMT
jgi:hypothetical protein